MLEIARIHCPSIFLAFATSFALLSPVHAASAPQHAAVQIRSSSALTSQPAAGCQPRWLPTFGGMAGMNDTVSAMTVFDDGNGPALYVGGAFTLASGVVVNHIAKWNGSIWSALGGGMSGLSNASVSALTVFDDGSGPAVYAAGYFSMAGGVAASSIAKWNGSTWSALGSGVGGAYSMAVFDDGSGPALFVGGQFSLAGGVPAKGIAKWDGSNWSPLGGGVDWAGSAGWVDALAVFDDGGGPALYAGGVFTNAGGMSASHIAKWNGAGWSALGFGTLGGTHALAVFDDGSGLALYAAGSFGGAGTTAANHIAKWDGLSWTVLGNGITGNGSASSSAGVSTLAVFDDGSGPALYVGGGFGVAGGTVAHNVAKWNGSSWSALGNGTNSTGYVNALTVFDDGHGPLLYAGGSFTIAGGIGANRSASWNGTRWSVHGGGLNSDVLALTAFDDGSGPALYAGGDFVTASNLIANGVARWDGLRWSQLGTGLELGDHPSTYVSALAGFDDGSGPALYAGGNFSIAGGVPANSIAKWNGSTWSSLASGMNVGREVFALTAFNDGSGMALFAGGTFSIAGGAVALRVAKWNGTHWSPLGSGTNGDVRALVIFDEGGGPTLFAAGHFTVAGGVAASNIAKWNGTNWLPVGTGTDGEVDALAVFDDGSGSALYAGGMFLTAGGVSSNGIARWDGTHWHALGSGLNAGAIASLAVFDYGTGRALYAGGSFTSIGGIAANFIAKWDGAWSSVASGTGGSVAAMTTFDDGSGPALFVGGLFQTSPAGDGFAAKWSNPSGCGAPGVSVCEPSVGGVIACPCGSAPAGGGLGCDNSSSTGGASLSATGIARLTFDTVVFTTSGEKPTATSIVLQGDSVSANGAAFGQGVGCVAGNLKRMYVKTASAGSISAPQANDLHVHARSAALGDVVAAGSQRYYGVYYRDPVVLGACAATSTFNITQQLDILWAP